MSEKDLDYELLLAEVEDRLEDLRYEYGDEDLSEVKINEKLRDEFKEEKYKQVLIDLKINKESTGLKKVETKDTSTNLFNKDDKNVDTLVKVLLDTTEHIRRLDKRIRGFEEDSNKKWVRKMLIFVPAVERIKIISFLEGIWLPQNIISNKHLTMREFEGRMNKQLQDVRVRLENYPDHIVKPGTIKYIIGILLNEVAVVINAIESGNLGKIATDMITGSYNERAEPPRELNKDEVLKALTK
jgi:hypothetical protein